MSSETNVAPNVASNGYCTRCGGSDLQPLPPNSFSRKPGYVCSACGVKHRRAKSTWVYLAIVLIGLVAAGGGLALNFADDRPDDGAPRRSPMRFVVMGVAVAGWAGLQFRIPTVASKPKD